MIEKLLQFIKIIIEAAKEVAENADFIRLLSDEKAFSSEGVSHVSQFIEMVKDTNKKLLKLVEGLNCGKECIMHESLTNILMSFKDFIQVFFFENNYHDYDRRRLIERYLDVLIFYNLYKCITVCNYKHDLKEFLRGKILKLPQDHTHTASVRKFLKSFGFLDDQINAFIIRKIEWNDTINDTILYAIVSGIGARIINERII